MEFMYLPNTDLFYWLGNFGGWAGIGVLSVISFGFALWVKLRAKASVAV